MFKSNHTWSEKWVGVGKIWIRSWWCQCSSWLTLNCWTEQKKRLKEDRMLKRTQCESKEMVFIFNVGFFSFFQLFHMDKSFFPAKVLIWHLYLFSQHRNWAIFQVCGFSFTRFFCRTIMQEKYLFEVVIWRFSSLTNRQNKPQLVMF